MAHVEVESEEFCRLRKAVEDRDALLAALKSIRRESSYPPTAPPAEELADRLSEIKAVAGNAIKAAEGE